MTVRAIYENGVFRPVGPVNLPENAEVEIVYPNQKEDESKGKLDAVYAILDERYRSGRSDVAARHNEHQP